VIDHPFLVSFVASAAIGCLVATLFPGWIAILGYGAILALSFLWFCLLMRHGGDADTAIITLVFVGFVAAASLFGWTLGILFGRVIRLGFTEGRDRAL
jgi:hypothetical protein